MSQSEKTSEMIARIKDDQRFGDDPTKEFRCSINGKQLFQDEYFDSKPIEKSENKKQDLSNLKYKKIIAETLIELKKIAKTNENISPLSEKKK